MYHSSLKKSQECSLYTRGGTGKYDVLVYMYTENPQLYEHIAGPGQMR